MRSTLFLITIWCLPFIPVISQAQQKYPVASTLTDSGDVSIRLPDDVMPVLGCWFWRGDEFNPQGYINFIDKANIHSPYNILVQSTRAFEKEVTDDDVYRQIKLAAEYAMEKGIPMTVDLDVRLARRAFEAKYPDELQEMLILQEVEFSGKDTIETVVRSHELIDHYTGNTTNYISLQGSLLRVYSYDRATGGIEPNSLVEITDDCIVDIASKDSVRIRIPADIKNIRSQACVMVSFTHLAGAVFAPHLMGFQREIIHRYADVQAVGLSKDEWGFPPSFDHTISEFWYSKYRAEAYAERTGGRELLADCLLMCYGIKGKENERQMAINHFRKMSWQRNGALEDDFYQTTKKVFGADALVLVHPTWYPYPGFREYKKNGLDWWIATRDWAQTDELTPYAVRTALAKKWGSPVWYNMYYADNIHDYERSVWSGALAGGRINYHPIYPNDGSLVDRHIELLKGDLMQAESRVRLLNYISQSPLDCPVAVIFGHACTMNWAGPAYDDVGMELVDSLWRAGIPTDLIPSDEIESGNLQIDKDGWIRYGAQRYKAVVLYHPEFENMPTAEFFSRASKGQTRMFRMGDWTKDFNGIVFNGNTALPESMIASSDIHVTLSEIRNALEKQKIALQTPATDLLDGFLRISSSPPSTGFCRLIDGTVIQVAGTDNVKGDPIQSDMVIQKQNVSFDAVGIAAVRLDKKGRVQALAAGGLKSFRSGDLEILLDERTDLALWINQDGEFEGVIQGWNGNIPPQLMEITNNWARLGLPSPYSEYKH